MIDVSFDSWSPSARFSRIIKIGRESAAGIRALERLPDGKPRGERLFAFQVALW
jgi:hypothetical protein